MKKGISKKLLKNYIIIYMLTLALTLCVIFALFEFGNGISSSNGINYAEEIMKNDYQENYITQIKEHNGTVFIVNNDLTVIPLCGDNIPESESFTMSEWTDFIRGMDRKNRDFDCDIVYDENSRSWIVVEMPVAVKCSVNFNMNTSKEVLPEALFIVSVLCVICFMVIFIYIFIYSRLTSKYFIRPLDMFCNMLKNLEKGMYKERLSVKEDDEFGMLAESFNKLADSLENERTMRKETEDNRKRLILDISHDLKNPLTSTMGSLELCMERGGLNPEVRHYINMAYQNSRRADILINDLFEYSKLDSPDYRLKLKKADICEYMRIQIVEEIDAIDEAGFSSEFDIPGKCIYVDFDSIQLARVIHNLIGNTLKYNKAGTYIKIGLKENDNSVEIMIKDSGIGIDKKVKDEIFHVFVRNNENTDICGTGLGLTIAEKIVSMHNGTISLDTDINMGCTFTIMLPKDRAGVM